MEPNTHSNTPAPTPVQHSPNPQPKTRSWQFAKLLASWLIAVILAVLMARFAFQSYQVFGQSMEPALHEGDYLIISKLGATFASLRGQDYIPNRGDIVVVDSTLNGTRLIKRVIGLPGERITVSGGEITVYNDKEPNGFDPYEKLGIEPDYASGQLTTVVPDHHVFLVGDNRQAGGSLDSRNELGPVPTENIIGQLILRLYPFSDINKF